MKFIANSHNQNLDSHLIAVAIRSLEIIDSLQIRSGAKFDNQSSVIEKLKNICAASSLLHDIGKTLPSTQKFFNSKKLLEVVSPEADHGSESFRCHKNSKNWHGVYHQEVSWAFTAMLLGYEENVEYAVYWHHKAPVNQDGEIIRKKASAILSQITDNEDPSLSEPNAFIEMKIFFDEVLNRAENYTSLRPYLKPLYKEKLNQSGNSVPDYYKLESGGFASKFDNQAIKTLSLAIMIESDREISALSSNDLEKYLSGTYSLQSDSKPVLFPETNLNSNRDFEQNSLSQAVADSNKINIVAIDTGAGKTSVSLLAKKASQSGRELLFLLPERMQVEAMFESVKNDYTRIFNTEPKSLQASHTGQVILSTNNAEEVMDCDINILVFDRIISGFYNRARFFEFMKMIRSDLVIDEFHKFTQLQNMWPALSTVLTIRKWLDNRLTLLISATPDTELVQSITGLKIQDLDSISHDIGFFGRELVSPLYPEVKADVIISNSDEAGNISFTNGCLKTFNTIDECQEAYKTESKSFDSIIHSRFNDSDKKRISSYVLEQFGKKNTANTSTIFSAKTLQSSFNISRPNAIIPICLPFETPQELGRWARFGEVPRGVIILKENLVNGSKMYNENALGFSSLFKAYHQYITESVESGKKWNKREMMTILFDGFFSSDRRYEVSFDGNDYELTAKEISKRYILKYFKEAILNMGNQFPKRFTEKEGNKSNGQIKISSNILRGESKHVEAKIIDLPSKSKQDSESMSGPVPVNSFVFSKMHSLVFQDENSFAKKVFSHKGQKKIFDYLKWLIGTKDYPLPVSYSIEELESKYIQKVINNKDYQKYYALYSTEVGLFFVSGDELEKTLSEKAS